MAKNTNKYVRKLTRAAQYSFTVGIPKEIIEKYGWREKQKLSIEDEGNGKIVIRDWRSR